MFSFHWISVLLISVTFYTYLANVVFRVTWLLNQNISNLSVPQLLEFPTSMMIMMTTVFIKVINRQQYC